MLSGLSLLGAWLTAVRFVTSWCIANCCQVSRHDVVDKIRKVNVSISYCLSWGIGPEVDDLLKITGSASVFPSVRCNLFKIQSSNLFKVLRGLTSDTHSCTAQMIISVWSRELDLSCKYRLQMSDDILIGSQNCPQVALRMIQTE